MRIVAIIQARLTSTRFPRKVLEKVGGKSMIARVCEAARDAVLVDKVVVAWAENFPHLDENDVLGRFREVAARENAQVIVRLTSDCPLLTSVLIDNAISRFLEWGDRYLYLGPDGFDVQVFDRDVLDDPRMTHREHVICPPAMPSPAGCSVNTPEDLERVRAYA